jgi:FAD/FMN-containing dehydrogenase
VNQPQAVDQSTLDAIVSGRALTPGCDHWDLARAAWNLTADQHPAAVVYAESPDDVAAVVAFAGDNGLRVAAQGTGHGAGCRSSMEGMILIRTDRMTAISVDPGERVGRFEAGVIWSDAGHAAGEHDLAVLSGSAPDVGIVGYTTGGGFGWLARPHGLACNSVRSLEVVTADGQLRRVDADSEADLFWALRGGGGSFAVVCAIEFDLIALAEVFAGSVIYPADENAGDIVGAYREWAGGVPDEVTSVVRFLHAPALPEVPEALRDRSVITLGACYAGPAAEGERLIEPLRHLGEPVMDLFHPMPPSELVTIHLEPDEPFPALVSTSSLREAPAHAFHAFLEAAGPRSGSPLLAAELRQAGGKLASPPPGAGARSHFEGEYIFLGIGVPMAPEMTDPINQHIDRICDALAPWSTGGCYFNFADRPTALESLFDDSTVRRLREVKTTYDPHDVFCGNHPIGIA